jgi:rubrerythrin
VQHAKEIKAMSTNIFEISTVRPAPPQICELANLPSFETVKEMEDYHNKTCGGHNAILTKWVCHFCGCWHYWSTSPTDSNGAYKADADHIPKRITGLCFKSMREAAK